MKTKVVVFGAGGIIGQHMMISVPDGIDPIFTTRLNNWTHRLDFREDNLKYNLEWLDSVKPAVVVNLMGESNVDRVEKDPDKYRFINVEAPIHLLRWCRENGKHYVHVSTQAVFDGKNPPYSPNSPMGPVNAYGRQKAEVEMSIQPYGNWTVIRPTFVMGIRPFPAMGRKNPAEAMLEGKQPNQVGNRWFSVAFAEDVAAALWHACDARWPKYVLHVGNPERTCRFDLAQELTKEKPNFVRHESLGLAERPEDTTFHESCRHAYGLKQGLLRLRREFNEREDDDLFYRAKELAAFLKTDWVDVSVALRKGFHHFHHMIGESFREAKPADDTQLLSWYRKTHGYLWELSAYHLDKGFNYSGMCQGIIERLKTYGITRPLILGDGIGTLYLAMRKAGLHPTYNDLAGSATANFALARMEMRIPEYPRVLLTHGWEPTLPTSAECVLALDFFEHLTDVEGWARKVYNILPQGGYFIAQNAFAIGSGPEGSIPCHLERNDRFEKDWQPMMEGMGFEATPGNWWRKK